MRRCLQESLSLSKDHPINPVSTHRPWRQTQRDDWLLDVAEGRRGGGYEYVWTINGWYTAGESKGDDGEEGGGEEGGGGRSEWRRQEDTEEKGEEAKLEEGEEEMVKGGGGTGVR